MSENKTKIAIVGFGNVGRGVYEAIKRNPDMELVGIASQDLNRCRQVLGQDTKIHLTMNYHPFSYFTMPERADVAILCGGSKKDLPEQGPFYAQMYNTVDSFDTHDKIPEYFAQMNVAAIKSKKVALISGGWDPGTFSIERVLADSFIPGSNPQATYGLTENGGLSMGHSDAIRTIDGVQDARQYTHASPHSVQLMQEGKAQGLSAGDRMWRKCFVVLKTDTEEERERVGKEIKEMPGYFAPYRTMVHFVSQEELKEKYSQMRHDGLVVAAGETGKGNKALIEYKNQWESNPEATGNILVACARAVNRFSNEGKKGAFTMLDIPPSYFSPRSKEELLKKFM
ncbi:MAG: diaminopimelate dehydrogenase [Candidatus Pacearchaeota archaeon]